MIEKVTLHELELEHGVKVEYARILRTNGTRVCGQSIDKKRLSHEQLAKAVKA